MGRQRQGIVVMLSALGFLLQPLIFEESTGWAKTYTLEDAHIVKELAVAKIKEGKFGEAVQLLEPYTQEYPDDFIALELLGWSYYEDGRPSDARIVLLRAKELVSKDEKPFIDFLLGAVLINLGRIREGKEQMEQSLRDEAFWQKQPPLKQVLPLRWLLVIYRAEGNKAKVQELERKLEVLHAAEEAEVVKKKTQAERPFYLIAGGEIFWDSNVELASTRETARISGGEFQTATNKQSFGQMIRANPGYRTPMFDKKARLGLEYQLEWKAHYKEDVRSLDTLLQGGKAMTTWYLSDQVPIVNLVGDYSYTLLLINREGMLRNFDVHAVQAGVDWIPDLRWMTQFRKTYRWYNFFAEAAAPHINSRDGAEITFGARQVGRFWNYQTNVFVEYEYGINPRRGSNFYHFSHRGSLGVSSPLIFDFSADGSVSLTFRNFPTHVTNRHDFQYLLSAALKYLGYRPLEAYIRIYVVRNYSTDRAFDYARGVVAGGVVYPF